MEKHDFWKSRVAESAVLEPIDRISEVIFGLIMALTFVQIFMLVFLCTFPVAIPSLLIEDVGTALRTSNGMTLLLLFVGGYKLAQYADFRPVLSALIYTLIGLLLIVFTIALGG